MSIAPAPTRPINRVTDRLQGVRQTKPDQWQALCPAHPDTRPSLQITETQDGKVLLKCWPGCTSAAIVEAIGLQLADLFPDNPRQRDEVRRTTRYEYRDASGTLVATKVRIDKPGGEKETPWQGPDGTWGLKGVKREHLPLYRLPELLAADPAAPVIFVEGEKACDAARLRGLVTVTNPGGSGQERFGESLAPLAGRSVYLWPDNDAPGRKLMDCLAEQLEGVVAAVYRLEVPGLPEKGDAADFQGTVAELTKLIAEAPLYRDWTLTWLRARLIDAEAAAAHAGELERENARLRAELESAKASNRAITAALANPELKEEARWTIGIVRHVASLESRDSTPRDVDGRVRTSRAALAEASGCKEATIGRTLMKLHEWGILDKQTVSERTPDGQTIKILYIKLASPSVPEALNPLATLSPERPASRDRTPDRVAIALAPVAAGALVCKDHPAGGTVTHARTYCAEADCGEELHSHLPTVRSGSARECKDQRDLCTLAADDSEEPCRPIGSRADESECKDHADLCTPSSDGEGGGFSARLALETRDFLLQDPRDPCTQPPMLVGFGCAHCGAPVTPSDRTLCRLCRAADNERRAREFTESVLARQQVLPGPESSTELCACGQPLPPGNKYRCAQCVAEAKRRAGDGWQQEGPDR